MLLKKYRLSKKKDFERIFKEGKYYRQDFVYFKIAKNNLEIRRFGFVVSLKISKKAVMRNKIRRRLSEIIRLRIQQIKPGLDIVILTQPEIAGKSYLEIEQALIILLERARILI